MNFLIIGFVFLLGISIGSFVNVVIYRTLRDESFVAGRSRCDHCGKIIAWYDNIPLLSFFWLGGKCRYCRKPIAIQHPIVEALTGVLFIWWYLVGFAFFKLTVHPLLYIQPAYWLVVGILFLIILITDLTTFLIPDFTVVLLSVFAFSYRLLLVRMGIMSPQDLYGALAAGAGLAVFFLGLILLTRGRGMGYGDVKLALALGLILGWPRALVAVFLAFVVGALAGMGLILGKKRSFGQTIPFGPFLVVGSVIALMWGYNIWLWYLRLLS